MAGTDRRLGQGTILSDVCDGSRRGIAARSFTRVLAVALTAYVLSGCSTLSSLQSVEAPDSKPGSALAALASLPVKGRAPKAGYSRSEFGEAWTDDSDASWAGNGLSTREDILSRDLTSIVCKSPPAAKAAPHCVVASGVLTDPYTGQTIRFTRGATSSMTVQIDHVSALGDAWQKGAQQLTREERISFANDPLNLIAADGPTNQQKSASDAASWLPPNKQFRCTYVARQIAVKTKYELWVTRAEKDAMAQVLSSCPNQPLPTARDATSPSAIHSATM